MKSYWKSKKRMVFQKNLNTSFIQKHKVRQRHRNDQFVSPQHGNYKAARKYLL